MKSTYTRALTGSKITAPPIKRRWVYLAVAALILASALLARTETADLLTHPVGIGALVAVAAGFFAKKSMALTPWGLVCGALVLYGFERAIRPQGPVLAGAQLALVSIALVTAAFQLRVELVGGQAALRPARTRWGSVFVAGTACLVVLTLSRPDVQLVQWIREERVPRAGARVVGGAYGPVLRVGRLEDPAIAESSGLVASRRNPEVFWTHNDSGNEPDLYCIRSSGASCGTLNVAGATNRDWEDIAVGPGPNPGVSYLYIGDIGDNQRAHDTITVYRLPEPTPDAPAEPAVAITLRYPDGPHDAETLLVHPGTGDLYVVTKEIPSAVFRATAPLVSSSTTVLDKVAQFSIFANLADRTGGDISPDGTRVAIATYGGWYELRLPPSAAGSLEENFDSIWETRPARIATDSSAQWEAIAYGTDGRAVYMTSEGRRSAVYSATRR